MFKNAPFAITLAAFAIVVAGFVGWVLNIASIVGLIGDPITTMFIARCVGVFFAPLGAVLGYL